MAETSYLQVTGFVGSISMPIIVVECVQKKKQYKKIRCPD